MLDTPKEFLKGWRESFIDNEVVEEDDIDSLMAELLEDADEDGISKQELERPPMVICAVTCARRCMHASRNWRRSTNSGRAPFLLRALLPLQPVPALGPAAPPSSGELAKT